MLIEQKLPDTILVSQALILTSKNGLRMFINSCSRPEFILEDKINVIEFNDHLHISKVKIIDPLTYTDKVLSDKVIHNGEVIIYLYPTKDIINRAINNNYKHDSKQRTKTLKDNTPPQPSKHTCSPYTPFDLITKYTTISDNNGKLLSDILSKDEFIQTIVANISDQQLLVVKDYLSNLLLNTLDKKIDQEKVTVSDSLINEFGYALVKRVSEHNIKGTNQVRIKIQFAELVVFNREVRYLLLDQKTITDLNLIVNKKYLVNDAYYILNEVGTFNNRKNIFRDGPVNTLYTGPIEITNEDM